MQAPPPPRPPGNIITFYSYKGGTGRTMALANTACVLAERIGAGENVLVVDWDLEAPGLHQFLPARLRHRSPTFDSGLGAEPGLIDLFIALRDALPAADPSSEEEAQAAVTAALAQVTFERFIGETEVPKVHIVRAGRNDDGRYSKRVNTFDWEGLFRQAPTLYRRVAERLAERYRYVLIDSRTGITDISGICTSLLPEKLVVVFTPNRQSLTGVRELVSQVTAYRLGSDDLRPLLVYPLPSRIEISMEKLNATWRHGNPDAGVSGYQPMFQGLLKDCYALNHCDLTGYFNAVQIQQSADCAYGEVISVLQTSGERLSLASSYRVFVDRLLAAAPPWQQDVAEAVADRAAPVAQSAQRTAALAAAAAAGQIEPAGESVTAPAGTQEQEPSLPAAASSGKTKVFLSYAREDRARVAPVSAALTQRGYAVWFDREISVGVAFDQAIAAELDSSAVVIVFWSRASVASEWVKAEAGEGARRGVLVPVLLDESYPPLAFRTYQSADLRQDNDAGITRLLDDVANVATRRPSAETSFGATAKSATRPRRLRKARWWLAVAGIGAVVLAVSVSWLTLAPVATEPRQAALASSSPSVEPSRADEVRSTASRLIDVPDFKGRTSQDVQKVAEVLGLKLSMTDEKRSVESQSYLEGVVLGQSPAPGTQVRSQATITLTVATQTTLVPSVVGVPLGRALEVLDQNGLTLGRSDSIDDTGAKPGRVVRQSPEAGTTVPAGTKVNVGVAASPLAQNRRAESKK